MCAAAASELLEQAEAFAQDTLHTLWPANSNPGDPDQRERSERASLQFKILFLFPELSNWQRGFLATVYWQREALTRLINHPFDHRPAAVRVKTEHLIRRLEHSFMDLVGQIRSLACLADLSPRQLSVLESEFFQIKFLDTTC